MNDKTKEEKVKHIRNVTMSPWKKISEALESSNGNVEEAIKVLINQKQEIG